ncbi:putative N-acetyl-gamma-glutamyl-phosphate reductase [Burkholderia latens]
MPAGRRVARIRIAGREPEHDADRCEHRVPHERRLGIRAAGTDARAARKDPHVEAHRRAGLPCVGVRACDAPARRCGDRRPDLRRAQLLDHRLQRRRQINDRRIRKRGARRQAREPAAVRARARAQAPAGNGRAHGPRARASLHADRRAVPEGPRGDDVLLAGAAREARDAAGRAARVRRILRGRTVRARRAVQRGRQSRQRLLRRAGEQRHEPRRLVRVRQRRTLRHGGAPRQPGQGCVGRGDPVHEPQHRRRRGYRPQALIPLASDAKPAAGRLFICSREAINKIRFMDLQIFTSFRLRDYGQINFANFSPVDPA